MVRRSHFYDWQGERTEVAVGDWHGRLPAFYHDNDVFTSVHTAAYDAVAAALPSNLISPVRWTDGRALVAVTAFRYHAVTSGEVGVDPHTIAPYGEIAITAMATLGSAPPVLPLLRSRLGGFVLHLPVTTREARDAGVVVYGFPKFVADMDFREEPGRRQVRLAEGDSPILTLTVRPRGPVLADRRPLVAYTALHGELVETVVPVQAHMQVRFGASAGELHLGEHEVAESLRRLDIRPTALCAFSYLDHRSILPAGRVVGPAGDYHGYAGSEREFGRFTVSYPDTGPIDQYAPATAPALA